MPGGFLLDARRYEFYLVGRWIFSYSHTNFWALFWDVVKLLGNTLILLNLAFKLWFGGLEWYLIQGLFCLTPEVKILTEYSVSINYEIFYSRDGNRHSPVLSEENILGFFLLILLRCLPLNPSFLTCMQWSTLSWIPRRSLCWRRKGPLSRPVGFSFCAPVLSSSLWCKL